MVQEDKERCEMNKKMMLMPFLFLILMAVPMVDAGEGNETDVIILPPPPPPPPLPITNETDPVIIIVDDDIQEQLYKIYDWMWNQEDVMRGTRNMIREVNATLNDVIVDLDDSVTILMSSTHALFNDAISQNLELQEDINIQYKSIQELRQEVEQVYQKLETERAMRNNITIMFGLFCLVVIGATVVINKK